MLTFNDILRLEDINPAGVRLLRHQDSRLPAGRLHDVWRCGDGRFEDYQRVQGKNRFRVGDILASFIVTRSKKTVFVGLYRVERQDVAPAGMVDWIIEQPVGGYYLYDTEPDDRLDDYVGKLVIDWGKGALAWVQRASTQPKPVIEIAPQDEDPFPGFGRFACMVDDLPTLPPSWLEVLRSVKGVYVLVDIESGQQYVGSAKGELSLFGRLLQYTDGGDGGDVALKAAGRRKYQVSILEAVGSTSPDERIEQIESAWKNKLITRTFGLNRN